MAALVKSVRSPTTSCATSRSLAAVSTEPGEVQCGGNNRGFAGGWPSGQMGEARDSSVTKIEGSCSYVLRPPGTGSSSCTA
jgi:hypothetical protein